MSAARDIFEDGIRYFEYLAKVLDRFWGAPAVRVPGLAAGCTARCNHLDPRPRWDHEAKLEEDRGEIHTDDCGFFQCTHDHDPGDCCTAGQPGVMCRVGQFHHGPYHAMWCAAVRGAACDCGVPARTAAQPPPETRECEGCGQRKPLEEMAVCFLPGTGESYQCIACRGGP